MPFGARRVVNEFAGFFAAAAAGPGAECLKFYQVASYLIAALLKAGAKKTTESG